MGTDAARADYVEMCTGGFLTADPDDPTPVRLPLANWFAFAAKGSPAGTGYGTGFAMAGYMSLCTGGWLTSYTAPPALPSRVIAGAGSFAYAGKASTAVDTWAPPAWPSDWTFPGPPWPPGFNAANALRYVGIADNGTLPTGWAKMNEGVNNPNLAAKYLRGNTTFGGTGGDVEHTHEGTIANADTSMDYSGADEHLMANTSDLYALYRVGADAEVDGAVHTHTMSDNIHDNHANEHGVEKVNDLAAGSSIPKSRVIDWVGRTFTAEQLLRFPLGAILGFIGNQATIPGGWVLCDGNNGTPNLSTQFARGENAGGAADHTHAVTAVTSTQEAQHTHGTFTHANTTQTVNINNSAGGLRSAADPDHTHAQAGAAAHTHERNVTWDNTNNEPPYYDVLFIMRIAGDVAGNPATNLHVLFDPNRATPAGWTDVTTTFEDRMLVGREVGHADFGNYGNISADTHTHVQVHYMRWITAGNHMHQALTSGATSQHATLVLAGGDDTGPNIAHDHTVSATSTDGNHAHFGNVTTDSVDNKPLCSAVDIIKKS